MTSDKQKSLKRVAILGLALAVIAAALAAAPRLADLDSVRKRVAAGIAARVQGEIDFQHIRFAVFPRPRVVISGGRLTIPGTLAGRVDAMSLYPEILALLTGKIKIAHLLLERPEIDFHLPERTTKTGADPERTARSGAEDLPAPLPYLLNAAGREFGLKIEGGHLNLLRTDLPHLTFQDLHADIAMSGDSLRVTFRAVSSFCKAVIFKGGLNLRDDRSWGQIGMTGLNPQLPARSLMPPGIMVAEPSEVNLTVDFKADRFNVHDASFDGDIPRLVLSRGNDRVDLAAKRFAGTFSKDAVRTTAVLTELVLERPRLALSARFNQAHSPRRLDLEIEANDVDLDAVRRTVCPLGGARGVVGSIFDILRGGRASFIRFATEGDSADALGRLANMTLAGTLVDGRIRVPGLELSLDAVGGEVTVSGETLAAHHLVARYGDSRVLDGDMRLGLTGEDAPFHLDLRLQADLGQVPALLKKIPASRRWADGLDRIDAPSGTASGRLLLGETLDDIRTAFQVADFSLSAGLTPMPGVIQLRGTNLAYAAEKLTVGHLACRWKGTSFDFQELSVNWEERPCISVNSGTADMDLAELHAWLSAMEPLRSALKKIIRIDGRVQLAQLAFSGPFERPRQWSYDLAGNVTHAVLRAIPLPAPVSVNSGQFRMTPGKISFKDFDSAAMDAAVNLSGRIEGYPGTMDRLTVDLAGRIGRRANRWLQKHFAVPAHLLLKPPLVVSTCRIDWNRNGKTAIRGDFRIPADLHVYADVIWSPDYIHVQKCTVQDAYSNAELAVDLRQEKIVFRFKGNLQKSTVDSILADNRIFGGWFQGDMTLNFDKRRPMDSVFRGTLTGEDLVLLTQFDTPVRVAHVSIAGREGALHLESDLRLSQDRRWVVKGAVTQSDTNLVFDLDASASGIVLERLLKLIRREPAREADREGGPAAGRKRFWDYPVAGVVRIDSEYLSYQRHTLRPFRAEVALSPDKIDVAVKDTELCGIALPGTLTVTPGEVRLDFSPAAQNRKIQPAAVCLLDKHAKVDGRFNLNGNIRAQGAFEDLPDALQGDFVIDGTEGRIYAGNSFGVLREVLAFLSVTEIFRGKLPELGKAGFGYNSIKAKGRLDQHRLIIEEGSVDGLTMGLAVHGDIDVIDKKMDVILLVAPFKTVDAIIRHIPLVGDILNGNLISVPFRVTGTVESPQVTALPPEAIGEGLVGILKRTLELPIKIIRPDKN